MIGLGSKRDRSRIGDAAMVIDVEIALLLDGVALGRIELEQSKVDLDLAQGACARTVVNKAGDGRCSHECLLWR
jgi:hypothetical protein